MGKLIDAEEAYKTLTEFYHHTSETQHKALKEALDRVPGKEIIHCKDCKYGEYDKDGWWHCIDLGGSIMGDGEKGDGFCSDAERRKAERKEDAKNSVDM